MMAQVDELQQTNAILAQIEHQQMLENVEKEARRETARAAKRAIAEEEKKISRVAEETADVNDRLTQRVKDRVGETEISKLTSGEPVSEATKIAVAAEVRNTLAQLQEKRDAIEKTPPASSTNSENMIQNASRETQLGILNERIDLYQQFLFQLGRSSKPVAPTRISDVVNVVSRVIGDTCCAADPMSYREYVEHQISQLPERLRSNPNFCGDIAAGYFVFKGLAKIGQGVGTVLGTLDNATGNRLSWAAQKIGEGFEAFGTATEKGLTTLGAPTSVAQNTADLAEISAQLFGPAAIGGVAKTAALTAGATKFCNAALGAVTKSTSAVLKGCDIGMSWTGNWFKRGYAFENYLESMFPGAKLPYGFKTFDFFKEGTAISAKTLDTNTLARINKPELVRYQINGYINKMIDFTRGNSSVFPLTSEMITVKELHIAIPANTSAVHMQQIMASVEYGAMNGIKVVITKVR